MKKKTRIIILSGFCVSIIIISLIIVFSKVKNVVSYTTFKKAYSIVSCYEESDEFHVEIYIDATNSFLGDAKRISNTDIRNKNLENVLNIDLIDIEFNDEASLISNKKFYLYDFKFNISFKTKEDINFEINNAYLHLGLEHGDEIDIPIGSFSYYKIKEFGSSDLRISRLKGIVNEIDDYKTLCGIEIEFKKNASDNMLIKNFSLLDLNIYTSKTDIKALEKSIDHSQTKLEDILGYHYNMKGSGPDDREIDIRLNAETSRFLFPIKYINQNQINRLGFLIIYEINGIEKKYYYSPYTFFNSYSYSSSQVSELVIYKHENY